MSVPKKIDTFDQLYAEAIHPELREHMNWSKILIANDLSPSKAIEKSFAQNHRHVCQENHPHFVQDLNTSMRMIQDENALAQFPLSTIFSPESVGEINEKKYLIFEQEFYETKQKSQLLSRIEVELKQLGLTTSLITDMLTTADELFTNAIYNAPFVDLENTNPGAKRGGEPISIPVERAAKLFIGVDNSRLVIGCKDHFGSLNLLKLFKRIKSCYDTSVADNMNMTSGGGAGIGSFLVFNFCSSYYAAIKEGQYTVICCAVPIKMTGRARLKSPKNLHFVIESMED